MKLKGKEKYFWKKYFNISNIASIPQEIDRMTGIDSEEDDQYFFYLTGRVSIIREIYLRCTNVTDEGVKYICNLKNLKELTLRNHIHITKECLPHLNKLSDLEYLDISKNNISLEGLYSLTNLKNLKKLYISSDKPNNEIIEELAKLKIHFPDCEIIVC